MSSRREAYEFSQSTKLEAFCKAGWCCERCGKHRREVGVLYAHHKLAIDMAIKYHPEIALPLIKSIQNLEVLCNECHKLADRIADRDHDRFALSLQVMSKLQQSA